MVVLLLLTLVVIGMTTNVLSKEQNNQYNHYHHNKEYKSIFNGNIPLFDMDMKKVLANLFSFLGMFFDFINFNSGQPKIQWNRTLYNFETSIYWTKGLLLLSVFVIGHNFDGSSPDISSIPY
jgi:hypothetical protein